MRSAIGSLAIAITLSSHFVHASTRSSDPAETPPEPGHPRCGLGALFHKGRRDLLASNLGEGIVLMRGLPATRDYARFTQDKNFWYLTGVESPDAALIIDVRTKKEILFLPRANAITELWEGEIWDAEDEWVPEVTGIADVRSTSELTSVLKELALAAKIVWIARTPNVALAGCRDRALPYDRAREKDPLDGRPSREDALAANVQRLTNADVRDLSPILHEMRRVKTEEEIGAMRRAAQIGAEAMSEAIRSTAPGRGEWQIESVMSFVHRREGAEGPAYHAIVGSGPNALLLHYSDSDRVMQPGEMLLLDYGPEVDHYTSDITRSWPTDGVFTARMAEIYDAVLAAQEAGIAAVKPGRTMEDIDKACRKVLLSRGLGKLMPHGACHYIGMEVHDVGDNNKPFEVGVAFTIEPGVYDPDSGIGVRIEDVVVVTADGCDVITRDVPKSRKEIVELIHARGILDDRAPTAGDAAKSEYALDPR